MSHMADRDHIAITTSDKSSTTRNVSVLGCPVAPRTSVTQGDSSDTYSRIAPVSEIVPAVCPERPGARTGQEATAPQLTCSYAPAACHRVVTLAYIARASSRCPLAAPSIAAPISATDSSPERAASLNRYTSPP
jgi:hypothetical protein